ncbi:putative leucine aminopeptidase 2-like protein 3 [Colletotrichum chlorophyti]|uniref:Peptide hydrolase n=1 Tax=Colletotrichum chlorophyti TaxID=708187 RepID=A0A1Q8RA08_9PEZI|nr:putative leucine aminopeptidase 2-like protein 3 [Colletotrichum chlorophyti]
MKFRNAISFLPRAALSAALSIALQNQRPLVDSVGLQGLITSDRYASRFCNEYAPLNFPNSLQSNLIHLHLIAAANGGNRAFGHPGYNASVDFVWSRISTVDNAKVWKQDFNADYGRKLVAKFTVNGKEKIPVIGTGGSPFTPAEGITTRLIYGPEGQEACNEAAYFRMGVKEKIVLVHETKCPGFSFYHGGVIRPAGMAGASAVIVINGLTGERTSAQVGPADDGNYVPAAFVSKKVGDALLWRLKAGEVLNTSFWLNEITQRRPTQNVFAETEGGDENNVIIVGAHLDSRRTMPGINNNGSGASLLLELFLALTKFRTNNKIRFVWWGAGESNLQGSRHYVNNLNSAERNSILAYLNFDSISKVDGQFGVLDGGGTVHGFTAPPGSDVIQHLFASYVQPLGIQPRAAKLNRHSDYTTFLSILKKPVGGLVSVVVQKRGVDYREPCDNITNVNLDVLKLSAKVSPILHICLLAPMY